MSQAAHSEDWPPAVRNSGGGRRIRFEMARSQLLVLTAALAMLAMLFFLSGLAIGLLLHPRGTSSAPHVQTEVRSSVTVPRIPVRDPARQTNWVSAGSTPPEEIDLADIVWQPRRSLEPWERAPVDAPSPAEPASQLTEVPSQELPSEDAAIRVAQAKPVVDPTFEPRPGGLAQPPQRWRQSQPLAAAYLTSPEEAVLPASADSSTVEPSSDSGTKIADGQPTQTAPDQIEPDPSSSLGADDDSLPRPVAPPQDSLNPSDLAEDGGWRPSSSHWQSFYDDLLPGGTEVSGTASNLGESAGVETVDVEPIDFETQTVPLTDLALAETVGESSAAASSPGPDADPLQDLEPEVDDGGWQPSSNLWQSFLDDPYDWTADRLPPEPSRRSTVPRGSMQVPYGDLMDRAARLHGLDVALVAAMVRVESDFDPQAVSHRGARGLMQVMPATAQRFGVAADDLFDPAVNLDVGMRYLAWLEDRFAGDTERMLAAYNAGEAAVDAYDGVPPYGETQRYVKRIYRLMGWAETQ